MGRALLPVATCALVALAACSHVSAPEHRDAETGSAGSAGSAAPVARVSTWNTRRIDYIGPDACGECHAEEHARWSKSLHRVMNARAETAGAVIGDFNTKLAWDGGEVRFSREGGAYVMTLEKAGARVRYRVTRTIGHRGLQEYVGVEEPSGRVTAGPSGTGSSAARPAARDLGREAHGEDVRLPFGWWPAYGGWAPQIAFDPWLETFDAYRPVREPWAERCPWCHSTYPFEQRIARSQSLGVGHGLEQLVGSASGAGRERLDVDAQVTVGISCESCHLGGRAHADGAAIQFLPHGAASAGLPAAFDDQRKTAEVVNGVCAQCHSGPSPRLSDGTALRNSSEALDLAASPCTNIKCTDCHDPHRADARGDEARAIAACVHCHQPLADAAGARAHAGPGHAGVTCLDCHMPKIVLGIDRFVRTHRISAPTNLALYAEGAPNACNTCHLDRSTRWTLDALELHAPAKAGIDLDAPLGDLWLTSPSPALRVLATWAYAASPLARYVDLRRGLADPVPYVRAWTKLALQHSFTKPSNPR
ncbi:MAG TPA: ammonia-forming cytochrome c nitrite reductase subunit c552 [Kofleriaceae bacterium]|nr:ammonia-forming cytochrome c nitrite reductase subunit c552 [Kofleriaceae bacterium]